MKAEGDEWKSRERKRKKEKEKPLVFNSFNCATHAHTLYANEIFTIHWAYTMAKCRLCAHNKRNSLLKRMKGFLFSFFRSIFTAHFLFLRLFSWLSFFNEYNRNSNSSRKRSSHIAPNTCILNSYKIKPGNCDNVFNSVLRLILSTQHQCVLCTPLARSYSHSHPQR